MLMLGHSLPAAYYRPQHSSLAPHLPYPCSTTYQVHYVFLIIQYTIPGQNVQYTEIDPLKPELNPICYLLALLGAHHFLHVSMIRVKLLTLR